MGLKAALWPWAQAPPPSSWALGMVVKEADFAERGLVGVTRELVCLQEKRGKALVAGEHGWSLLGAGRDCRWRVRRVGKKGVGGTILVEGLQRAIGSDLLLECCQALRPTSPLLHHRPRPHDP